MTVWTRGSQPPGAAHLALPYGTGLGALAPQHLFEEAAHMAKMPAAITVDLAESPVAFELKANLPGYAKDEVEVTVDSYAGTLRIAADHKVHSTHWDNNSPTGWHVR